MKAKDQTWAAPSHQCCCGLLLLIRRAQFMSDYHHATLLKLMEAPAHERLHQVIAELVSDSSCTLQSHRRILSKSVLHDAHFVHPPPAAALLLPLP